MILEWLAGIGSAFVTMVAGLLPVWEPPEWFTSVGPQIQGVLATADGLGVWVNFAVASTVATAVLATYVVGFVIKLVLRAGSHVPQFGGAG